MIKDIDYALVEEKRPPMYTSMKYWGKKPHNIWNEYIKTYTKENDIVLDPFSGSAVAAFEAVRCNRKAIAFDINPLTSFIIDVYSTEFDRDKFKNAVREIYDNISKDECYNSYYNIRCTECGNNDAIIQHFKWENNKIYEYGVECPNCKKRYLCKSDKIQEDKAESQKNIVIKNWYPKEKFYKTPSISNSFLKNIGGNSFADIWTKRNMYVLSKIFNLIDSYDEEVKKQLIFGLIQSVHLCSKMCVPRRAESNRSFSTSWGRSAFICSARQMEMNPLLVFFNNCIGKQSVESAMLSVKKHVGKTPKSYFVADTHKTILNLDEIFEKYDIIYGVVDINDITQIIPEEKIKFVITDPPYGGLVQYMDLSQIWLIWLKHFDSKYEPQINKEITIKKGIVEVDEYCRRFTAGIRNLYSVLKDNEKIVFTFHNKEIKVWNAFLRSLSQAGFRIEKVIHQQNKRTGESNVANPYGTSASDFYIRCSKSEYVERIRTNKDEFENFIVDRAVKIISARNEPTPYQILFNGLLSEISKAGFDLEDFDENISNFLEKHIGNVFVIENTEKVYGPLWWLTDVSTIKENVVPLSQRVEVTVREVLKEKREVKIDEILAEIFINYPNGLTPDIKKIDEYVKKYAYPSGERWIYNGK